MDLIFFGLFLMNMDFTLNIGSNVINLLPGFVGIILLYKGMRTLADKSKTFADTSNPDFGKSFRRAVIWVLHLFGVKTQSPNAVKTFVDSTTIVSSLAFYSLVIWLLDVVGLTAQFPNTLTLILGLVATLLNLYLCNIVVEGMKELEKAVNAELNSKSLRTFWIMLLAMEVGSYMGILTPLITLMCLILRFFVAILFLAAVYKSGKLYNQKVYGVYSLRVKQ